MRGSEWKAQKLRCNITALYHGGIVAATSHRRENRKTEPKKEISAQRKGEKSVEAIEEEVKSICKVGLLC